MLCHFSNACALMLWPCLPFPRFWISVMTLRLLNSAQPSRLRQKDINLHSQSSKINLTEENGIYVFFLCFVPQMSAFEHDQ